MQFLQDPSKVEPSWRYFFEGIEFGQYQKMKEAPHANDDLRVYRLIEAYRRFGHLQASTNPMATQLPLPISELDLTTLNFEEKELATVFSTGGILKEPTATLSKIIDTLKSIYCGTKGIEYMGFHSLEMEKWLQNHIEPCCFSPHFSIEQKTRILKLLNQAEIFETFLHTKYVGQKRFSLEGGETLIPILDEIVEKGAELGVDEFVIGMAHRGRLNVLANVLNKSFSMIFSEFEDYVDENLSEGSGDVKYHKGFSSNITTTQGHQVHISLTANPSHLESVNPVVQGKVKAKQIQRKDNLGAKIVPILIHGDASIAGQGVLYETLQLYQLEGYGTGGTIHIVVNNQIGFTTLSAEYRSSQYCTDIARAFGFPVFHVNAEDPEGCIFVTQMAIKLRYLFHCDVFIELNCYRKYGHNESDEPAFTQPLEYQFIRKKKTIREIYRDTLIQQGILEKEIALSLEEEFKKSLNSKLKEIQIKKEVSLLEAFEDKWKTYQRAKKDDFFQSIDTTVDISVLKEISNCLSTIPENFEIHKKLYKIIEERKKMGLGERLVDWAMGEHLAFGSLLWEGIPVRLSGQDSRRGTFTQRHAVWVDQNNGQKYFPLENLKNPQGEFTVFNSSLSEFAVLGFEYGYSLAYPSALVIWEAQFGDFANGGQVIFDQYLSASAQKWQRYSGLVVLLPHGYEGQGPEHSSARMERFLQLAAELNLQIVYPSTPAQYFHLLRRQIKKNIRIPLIIFTPKGLLRHPGCVSNLDEFSTKGFQEIIDDVECKPEAERIIFCTGRIYYDLIQEKLKRQAAHTAIVRIEQLYPLHQDFFMQVLKKYTKVKEYCWVQEEPQNMGAFNYMHPLLQRLLPKNGGLHYVGRNRSASTATGSHKLHEKEHMQLMDIAFTNFH